MQQTDSVFSYIYARKIPTITYKRKQHTYGNSIPRSPTATGAVASPPFIHILSSTQQHTSTTTPTPLLTAVEKENTETQSAAPKNNHQPPAIHHHAIHLDTVPSSSKDIFDLPDDDSSDTQVEIRVASSLHSNNRVKTKSTGSTSSNNHKKVPKITGKLIPTPSGNNHHKRNIKQTSTRTPPPFARTLSAPVPTTTISNTITPLLVTRNISMLPRLPDTKRRKRNLVSQLKAANGERPDYSAQSGVNRFYEMLDDDDNSNNSNSNDEDIHGFFNSFIQSDNVSTERNHDLASPSRSALISSTSSSTTSQITPTESAMCSNDYNHRMEQELAELMQAEFGQEVEDGSFTTAMTPSSSSSSSSSSSQRGCYIPENTIRAPVTYKRSNNIGNKSITSRSSDASLSELDQEMEQQIQYILSNDF